MLSFSVKLSGPRPAAAQIVDAAQAAIADGTLKNGDAFPSVRELSRELKVNPKTAHKAMQLLLQMELLVAEPGQGTTIAWSKPKKKKISPETHEDLKRWATQARLQGADLEAQRACLESIWNDFSK